MIFFRRFQVFKKGQWVSSVDSFLLFSGVFKWLSHVETMSTRCRRCVNHPRKPSRCKQTKKNTKQSYYVDSSSHSRSCFPIDWNHIRQHQHLTCHCRRPLRLQSPVVKYRCSWFCLDEGGVLWKVHTLPAPNVSMEQVRQPRFRFGSAK